MPDIQHLLQENEMAYEIIKHRKPIRSAKEGAVYFGIELGQTAPIFILETENGCDFIVNILGIGEPL
ncbi:hypothetical protein KDJ56_10655 [Brevibacillus composti]|uniref:Uncharacterized protein n=1 Tax=Brevibacillus composti TaxID=2796470 RepID=A0A7T5EPD2_9BACL|nr:hypothetical protein [Brevibacillus composti]QQE76339.1 hypothetical protein JD108_10970 [Brevibacillus composti]QUO43366.1 hypothetical protein KDJ56_10655 [Brevibacillus composti]